MILSKILLAATMSATVMWLTPMSGNADTSVHEHTTAAGHATPAGPDALTDHSVVYAKEKCDKCNGKGKLKCSSCGGDGGKQKVSCYTCSGTGRVKSKGLDIRTPIFGKKCTSCDGKGKVTTYCSTCSGKGKVACDKCDGSGKIMNIAIPNFR